MLKDGLKRNGAKPLRPSDCFANAESSPLRRLTATAALLFLCCTARPALAGDLSLDLSTPTVLTPTDLNAQTDRSGLVNGPQPRRASPNWLSPDNFSLSVGASAWSGDFGSPSTTTISAALLSGAYSLGDLHLSATLPYTRITTAGAIFLGLGAAPLIVQPQTGLRKRVNEGVGDLTFNASYVLHPLPSTGLEVELLGGLKAPTAAASSHVSTGEADVSFGAELSRPFGRLVPFASLVYRDFGSPPQSRLRDGPASSVGLSYVIADRWVANASYDYARSASRFVADSHELVSSLSYKFARSRVRVSAYASAGLSSGAPAVSGGLSLGRSF